MHQCRNDRCDVFVCECAQVLCVHWNIGMSCDSKCWQVYTRNIMATTNSYTIWQIHRSLRLSQRLWPPCQLTKQVSPAVSRSDQRGLPENPLRHQLACRAELECGIGQIPQSNANSNGKSAWIPIHISPLILYHISYTLRNLETIDNHSIVWDLFIFPGPVMRGIDDNWGWHPSSHVPQLDVMTLYLQDVCPQGEKLGLSENWGIPWKIANAMIKYDFMMINHRILPISNTPTSQRS